VQHETQRGEFVTLETRPLSSDHLSVVTATAGMTGIGLAVAALWLAFHGGGTTVEIAVGAGIPIAVALVVLGAGGALADVPPLRWPGWLAPAGAIALPAVAALSFGWTASPSLTSRAVAAWTLPAVVFILSAAAFRTPGSALMASVAVVATSAVVAVVILLHLLARSGGLFLYGRLSYPLDYANGAAALLWIGAPAAVGLTTDSRLPRLFRGLSAGVAAALVTTGALALSRGGTIALTVSLVVIMVLSPERLQVFLTSVGIAVAFLAAYPLLFRGGPEVDTPRRAAGIAVAFLVGVLVGLTVGAAGRLVRAATRRRPVRFGIASAATAVAVVGIAVAAPSVSRALSDFTKPPTAVPGGLEGARARFGTVRSNRWQYWRIALHTWREHPVAGLGAGTFPISWYSARTGLESSTDSHGWPFQLAAEEGLLGLIAIGLFAVGIAYAAWHACRRRSSAAVIAGLAASTAYFFAHGAVDWLFTMSSVYFIGMMAAGAVVGAAAPSTRRLAGVAVDGAIVLLGVLALIVLVPTWAVSTYLARGEKSIRVGPALANLREARRWNPWGIAPLQTAADVEASSGALRAAAQDLRLAAARDPQRWEVWSQLEQVLLQLHRPAEAKAAADRVRRLNPLGVSSRRS
jgi:hypothetical protein